MNHWFVAAIVLGVAILWIVDRRFRFAFLRLRRDHEGLWHRAFDEVDFPKVDCMLRLICEAFLLPHSLRFRIRPSDDVHGFYRRNMRFAVADALEYETLAIAIEKHFGVDLEPLLQRRPCFVEFLIREVAVPTTKHNTEQIDSPNSSPAAGSE